MPVVFTMILMLSLSFAVFAEDTELKLYRPFAEGGKPTVVVTGQHPQAQCFEQSRLISREDAWRCMAEGKVYDPCFVRQYSNNQEALCLESPWISAGVLLHMPTPVNNAQHTTLDLSTAYPWALELDNGEHCNAVDSSEMLEGLPLRYRCGHQVFLMGHLQRCKAKWSILEKNPNGQVATVTIKKAWF